MLKNTDPKLMVLVPTCFKDVSYHILRDIIGDPENYKNGRNACVIALRLAKRITVGDFYYPRCQTYNIENKKKSFKGDCGMKP